MLTKLHKGKKIIYGFRCDLRDETGKRKQVIRRNANWSRKDAENAEREFLQTQSNFNSITVFTFNDLYKEYMKQKDRNFMKLRSQYDLNKVSSKHILPVFGNMILTKIEPKHVEKWQDQLINATYTAGRKTLKHQEHYSNRQLVKIQTNLNAMFEFAIDKRLLQFNPFRFVGLRKRRVEPKSIQINIISPVEFSLLYNTIQLTSDTLTRLQDTVIFSILFWCGLRKGELMALDIKDYDILNKKLKIYKNWDYITKNITAPKTTNGTRDVPVCDLVDEAILELIAYYKKIQGYSVDLPLVSFTSRLAPSTLTRKKDQYFEKAGIPRITIHDFRHSHVSYLINCDDKFRDFDIAKRIGDTVQEINETYGHLILERQNTMVAKMNEYRQSSKN